MSMTFPKWFNIVPPLGALFGLTVPLIVIGFVWYYFTPKFWEVGYMPTQPGSGFSHQVHAGKLGMDCRYCHSHVESSAEANIPNVSTCMGCHTEGRLSAQTEKSISDPVTGLSKVAFIREAYEADESIKWRRVHKLPDYVRNFPHNVHVNAGVSCAACHGMIPRMEVVHQVETLSMGWCLDCHRGLEAHDPEYMAKLVPPSEVTDLFKYEDGLAGADEDGEALLKALESKNLHLLPENCGACHY